MEYRYKTAPLAHQQELFARTRDVNSHGVFWDPGVGKTKPTIDTAAWLYARGEVNGLLVVAPNGVHRNWVSDELPAHLPLSREEYDAHVYHAGRAGTRSAAMGLDGVLRSRGLAVLVMSYDAFITDRGRAAARAFLERRRTLMVADESTRIKTPGAKRTKMVIAAGRLAPYRRILTGTPIVNSPFDVYSQVRFLEPDYWKARGMGTFLAFQAEFGVFKMFQAGGRSYTKVVAYKRLEQLSELLQPISSRLAKDDVLDLPPKVYQRRYFEMTPTQRRVYTDLRDTFIAQLADGSEVTAPLAIVRLTRLHQVSCGYVPSDETRDIQSIPGPNPRLQLLSEIAEDLPHKTIIWARFRRDLDLICELLGNRAVRYDGSTTTAERPRAIERFRTDPDVQFFVANPAAIGTGVTLTEAKTVIYYNNSFSLEQRLQSEDRAHRIGQTSSVNYIDLIGEDTVDERIVAALRSKYDIATLVNGDTLREWL